MKINLEPEFQYQLYLNQAGLVEANMNKSQRIERKRTFYAAYGMAFKVCQDEAMLNNKGMKLVKSLFRKLADYFTKETINQNQN